MSLIIWGLAVALNRQPTVNGVPLGSVAPVSSIDHIRGPENAKVTIIEYSDFQCPACETYYWMMERLFKEATTSVRLIYRHFPLPQHANAVPASMATEAAGAQGKFWEMYDLVFANHADWTESADPTNVFIGYADKIGLNKAKFVADLNNPALKDHVGADLKSGQTAGINQTPTFYINGKVIETPRTYADFKKLIDQAASTSTN
jgi:protein-disulfide isomerase